MRTKVAEERSVKEIKYDTDPGAKIIKKKVLPNGWHVILQEVEGEFGYFSVFAQNEKGQIIEGDFIDYPKEAETSQSWFSVKKEKSKAIQAFEKLIEKISKRK